MSINRRVLLFNRCVILILPATAFMLVKKRKNKRVALTKGIIQVKKDESKLSHSDFEMPVSDFLLDHRSEVKRRWL